VAGDGGAGFGGDGGPASQGTLHTPGAVAVGPQGVLYIADSGNGRVRAVDPRNGRIATAAGRGRDAASPPPDAAGDGGSAAQATLGWPGDIAVAPNGDMYIADTDHHRVRRVDAQTGTISTVAGTGEPGDQGDGGPASMARLAGPTGLALVVARNQVILYIADAANGRIRVVTPDGRISSLAIDRPPAFGRPARLAYDPRGWLYVAGSQERVAAVSVHDGGARQGVPSVLRRVM
jgi:hypothetical protein